MITGQIKNQIDSIWDTFWTGGITNSITILEQMTYLFFMKMLDDSQIHKEVLAKMAEVEVENPTFTDGNWLNPETNKEIPMTSLRWSNFKDYEATQLFEHVRTNVFPFIKHLNSGADSAYSRFMENAIFLIQSPRTLVKVVDGINSLDMNNRDTMGDTYEYILGKMAASGNNGQFRTPRHIIRMMVELMKPTLGDIVCDPAMGSAGFIVETAKYISEHYKSQLMKRDKDEHFRNRMFHGFDTDQTMLRIGAMNLKLHKVDNPDIAYRDSLSSDNEDNERYTLILANPPFAGSLDNDSVAKSLLSITKTKKTELLFLSLFLRSLQTGGRCASIVPDGVLTGSSKAHKDIRKAIVDDNILEAVISMPSGVFQPYSGVSTAILIFKKTGSGGTDKVWFYNMTADGYSLDQKRTEVSENDIPDIIARYNNLSAESDRKRTEQSFLVPVDEIREHGYDLAFNTYKETVREVVVYESPMVLLARAKNLVNEIAEGMTELESLIANDHEV